MTLACVKKLVAFFLLVVMRFSLPGRPASSESDDTLSMARAARSESGQRASVTASRRMVGER